MENFSLYNPTKIYFGTNALEQLPAEILQHGKKALILMGKGSVRKSGLYDKITALLNHSGIQHLCYEGIKSNPEYRAADEAVKLAQDEGCDLILAIGGGSVIDTAKAVAMGFYHNGSVWDFYLKKSGPPTKALPLVNVLTLAATGTEMNAATVLQDTEGGIKRGYGNPLLYPKASFLDPTITYTVSPEYTAYGVADLMAHSLEVYFSKGNNELTSHYIASILKLAIKNGALVRKNPQDYEIRANIMWLATNALNGTLAAGRGGGDWGVHGFEHSLSVLYDIPHGAGLSIVYPAWLKHLKPQILEQLAFLGREVFDIDPKRSTEEQADGFIAQLEQSFQAIGTPIRLAELGIAKTEKERIVANLELNRVRGANYLLEKADYEAILDLLF